MGSIIISYELNPPASADTSSLESSKTQEFAIDHDTSKEDLDGDCKRYYTALAKSVREAQVKIGQELTLWRDAVGTSENSKETKVVTRNDDDDDELEEDEQ